MHKISPFLSHSKNAEKREMWTLREKVNPVSHRMSPKKGLTIQLRRALNENYVIHSLPHKTDNYNHKCQLKIKIFPLGGFFFLIYLKVTREKKAGQIKQAFRLNKFVLPSWLEKTSLKLANNVSLTFFGLVSF